MAPSIIQAVLLALLPIQISPIPLSHGVKIQPSQSALVLGRAGGAALAWPAGGVGQVDWVAPQLVQVLVASSTGPEQNSHCLMM